MLTAKKAKVIVVETERETGTLHQISRTVAEKGINIICVTGKVTDQSAMIRLITDDNLRARDALTDKGYDVTEIDAVLVELPHKPGILETVTERLAEAGIGIIHLAATAPVSQDTCLLLIETNDISGTVVELNKS